MSIIPENENNVIDYVAFAFVYAYNKNEMTAYNAMLNISSTGYTAETETDDSSSDSGEDSNTTEDIADEDNYIDYEVISESVDKSQPYMQTSSAYDSTNNYVVSETDEAGNTVSYTYDVNGNVTSTTDGEENVVNYTYNSSGNISQVSSYDAQNKYYYNMSGIISAIDHNNFRYSFNYDVWGNLIATKIGNVEIAKNTYNSHNGMLEKTTYANGDYLEYLYDVYDNIIRISGENGILAMFVYNKKGLVSKVIDTQNGTTTYYYYDFNGSVTGEYRQSDDGTLSYYLSYDSDGKQVEKTSVNGHIKTITRGSDENSSYVSNDGIKVSAITDDFGRATRIITARSEGQSVFFTNYEYANGKTANSTTNLVSKLTQKYGNNELVNYEYTYDGNGNIKEIKQNGQIVAKYAYDELNQLQNAADTNSGLYTLFSYDNAGNITSVSEYRLSSKGWYPSYLIKEKTYTYGDSNWKDKLTSYNGTKITYDGMGNPLSYRDGMSFTWENGRRLKSISTGNNTVNMKYDSNGMRTQKDDDNYTTNYYYDSKNNLIGFDKSGSTLFFYYDSEGTPTSFSNNGIMYYYVKNLQGDIVKIVKQDGTVAATYTYDAWGKILSIKDTANNEVPSSNMFHVANLNPYRYRGYIYDNETGLYYLNSRYYDPITGRFLNADDMQHFIYYSVLTANIYTYCNNNQVRYIDAKGTISGPWGNMPFMDELTDMFVDVTTNFMKDIIKNVVADYAATYLDSMGYYVSKKMFLQSLYGDGHEMGPEVKSKMIVMFQQNKNFMNAVKKVADSSKGYGHVTNNKGESGFEFTEGDLYYSVQHCDVFVHKRYTYGKRHIAVLVSDKYNFDVVRPLFSNFKFDLGNAANDLGYILQTNDMLTPYYWEISFTYYY